ncbi:MAG TPA: hypothetical protein VGG36_02590 [Rhizomicrobium sp.]|jgi:hypothetical protein
MGRTLVLTLVLVAAAAGAQATPLALHPGASTLVPVRARYDATPSRDGKILPRLNPVATPLSHQSSPTIVCAFCTGQNGGVGWQPR